MAQPITEPSEARQARRAAKTEARVQRRRRQILDSATELMAHNGFHAVSMQSVAESAGISVGLIYQYFASKDELLLAVITDILEDFRDQIPAISAAGPDPVERLQAAFRISCQVVDAKRSAVTLTYRESGTLTPEGLARIKELEQQTAEPIVAILRAGAESGAFASMDERLVVQNLLLLAHAWALKYWNLSRFLSLEGYVEDQFRLLLAGLRPRD